MAGKLNIMSTCQEIENELPAQEYALGKGLLQPFNNCNSGSRKIMQGIQTDQTMQLQSAETPIIMTGYETQFGTMSSTFAQAEADLIVIDKIPKYNTNYNVKSANFTLICLDSKNNKLDIINRVDYRHISESYGYSMNTDTLDVVNVGDVIPKDTPIVKANSFDEANNKCCGVNLTTIYMALAITTEDPIVLSESAAKRFNAPLFDSTSFQINDNDILLNLYGDNEHYKTFPDIGEEIQNGFLCAVRRERKEDEALYSQSCDHLKEMMVSDDKYMLKGKVIDIDVFCNNPEKLKSSLYNQQISHYYDMKLEYCANIVKSMQPFVDKKVPMTYEAEKLYYQCLWTIQGKQTISDKVFSNIYLNITTMITIPIHVGDKITDRYGGKGVVSAIYPDDRMPHYPTNRGGEIVLEPVDAIYNSSTIVNRENPGQSMETEMTYGGSKIIERIGNILTEAYSHGSYDDQGIIGQCENMLFTYMNIFNKEQAREYQDFCNYNGIDVRTQYLDSIVNDGAIYMCMPPMSSNMSIDMIREMYEAFPWIEQSDLYVTVQNSRGGLRQIKARRKIIVGKKYTQRLKQFAEEKFSSVSLASTNIRSENTKSKANKFHKAAHATTPVRFGEMEFLDMMHSNAETLIETLMLLSASPQGRRMFETLLVGDPFQRNVRIPHDATSRQVEKVDVYLKEIGLRLDFIKKLKVRNKVKQVAMTLIDNRRKCVAMTLVDPRLKDKIKELAKKRIDHKKSSTRNKMRAMTLVDPRTAMVINSFPEDIRHEVLHSDEIMKNASEITHIMDDLREKEAIKEIGELTTKDVTKLINSEVPVRKQRVIKERVMRLVNPNLPLKGNLDKE